MWWTKESPNDFGYFILKTKFSHIFLSTITFYMFKFIIEKYYSVFTKNKQSLFEISKVILGISHDFLPGKWRSDVIINLEFLFHH